VAVSTAETIKLSIIQGVSKILGQSSGVSSPHRNEEKVRTNIRSQALSFRGIVQQIVDLSTLDSSCGGHLTALLVQSFPTENGDTLHQRIFYACQTIHSCPGTFERVRQSMIRPVYTCLGSSGGNFEYLL
jgi:hypothetical protein